MGKDNESNMHMSRFGTGDKSFHEENAGMNVDEVSRENLNRNTLNVDASSAGLSDKSQGDINKSKMHTVDEERQEDTNTKVEMMQVDATNG